MTDLAAIRKSFPELESLSELAESGQRHVFRACRAGEDVVLKLIKATQEPEAIRREIEAVARLDCDYVPRVLESGVRAIGKENRHYLVEPFISGESYEQRLQREPRPSLPFVIDLARVLLRACAEFAAQGLVHRDLKPGNILIGDDSKIWIIDFGIVRLLDAVSLTPTPLKFGKFTLGYGAPEQMRNLKPQIDARADLFSVGVILYESLCGYQPYYRGALDQLEVMRRIVGTDLVPLELPEAQPFADFVLTLAARFPSRRPQTTTQALEWLTEATKVAKEGN